jgi:hypothetical protein
VRALMTKLPGECGRASWSNLQPVACVRACVDIGLNENETERHTAAPAAQMAEAQRGA